MRKKRGLIMLAVLLCGCSSPQGTPVYVRSTPAGASRTGEITYETTDGWTIYADFQPTNGAKKAVVLLHQRMGQASDWAPLVSKLSDAGIATLAIDQRGAGRSVGSANGDDAPWETSSDIQAAVDWLKAHGATAVGLAGASYGANNALLYAAKHPEIPAVALLSPGTDYHGLALDPGAKGFKQALLVLSAKGDVIMEDGPTTVKRVVSGVVEEKEYDGDAHGTHLLQAQPESADEIVAFFKARL